VKPKQVSATVATILGRSYKTRIGTLTHRHIGAFFYGDRTLVFNF